MTAAIEIKTEPAEIRNVCSSNEFIDVIEENKSDPNPYAPMLTTERTRQTIEQINFRNSWCMG